MSEDALHCDPESKGEPSERQRKLAHAIVMLTSSEQEVDRERPIAYQRVKTYLAKPLDESHLGAICKE